MRRSTAGTRHATPRTTRLAALALTVGLLGVTACSGGGSSGKAKPGSGAPAKVTCVSNVAKVIARKPTAASTSAQLPRDTLLRVNAAVQDVVPKLTASGVVVGVRTPRGTWTQGFGTTGPSGAPMVPGVITRIGTVTTSFTVTALLQLVEQKRVMLSTPVSTWVPGLPGGKAVTVEMVAAQTSGLADYATNPAFANQYLLDPSTYFPPAQLLNAAAGRKVSFAPGQGFEVTSTNTVLAGLSINGLMGRTLAGSIGTQLIVPLRLSGTSWPGESPALPQPHASGSTTQTAPSSTAATTTPVDATTWNPSWSWAAGELVSNVNDLLVWGRALGTGQGVLSPASQTTRLTSFAGPTGYGLGLVCHAGWVGYRGSIPGYDTTVFYDTTTDTTVVVQANSDIPAAGCAQPKVLTSDPWPTACSSPATEVFTAVANALGHPYPTRP